jgi:tight adherence protein B
MPVIVACLSFLAVLLAGEARALSRTERLSWLGVAAPPRKRGGRRWIASRGNPRVSGAMASAGAGLLGGVAGWHLLGPVGVVAGATAGSAVPILLHRRRGQRLADLLESQLTEAVEVTSLAVRGGFSLSQALEFAAGEVSDPMGGLLRTIAAEQRLGASFETALGHFANSVGTDDARLFGLVLGIHARSGGNLAGALAEVAATLRHRQGLRRELRAQTAQGRISGAILGALPIVFSLVLAITSRSQLEPVYRSPVGIMMVSTGLALEAVAYLWVRRLLRVRV